MNGPGLNSPGPFACRRNRILLRVFGLEMEPPWEAAPGNGEGRVSLTGRIVGVACLIVALAGVGSASAASETITLTTSTVPLAGKLFKEVRVPVNSSLSVEVHTPDAAPKVNPLKRSVMKFPTDLTYNPNNRVTPVCKDSQLNEQSNLAAGVAAIVGLCPKSVIGTGTAAIYLAKVHLPETLISDPQMVIFNAGRDSKGNAKMKIYAYSKATNYGILMSGSLTPQGIQDVAIPVLSNDSATARFTLSIPGPPLEVEKPGGGTMIVKGQDPNYARAKCSTGEWVTGGTFTLGERTFPAGTDTGPEIELEATPYETTCDGKSGQARLGNAKASGPKLLKRGRSRIFRVSVRNNGTATAKDIKVTVSGSGKGQARAANIAPGKSLTIPVKVKVTGPKGKPAKLAFRISGQGTRTRAGFRGRIAG